MLAKKTRQTTSQPLRNKTTYVYDNILTLASENNLRILQKPWIHKVEMKMTNISSRIWAAATATMSQLNSWTSPVRGMSLSTEVTAAPTPGKKAVLGDSHEGEADEAEAGGSGATLINTNSGEVHIYIYIN